MAKVGDVGEVGQETVGVGTDDREDEGGEELIRPRRVLVPVRARVGEEVLKNVDIAVEIAIAIAIAIAVVVPLSFAVAESVK